MPNKIVAENRRARFDFEIQEVFEAGLVLKGTEVKSLRFNRGDITGSYCYKFVQSLWIEGFTVSGYKNASSGGNHDPKRPKQLLLKKKQIMKLISVLDGKGLAVVPLEVYFNAKGWLKVKIAIARVRSFLIKEGQLRKKSGKEANKGLDKLGCLFNNENAIFRYSQ